MTGMRRPVIAGNWKMYKTTAESRALIAALRSGFNGRTPTAEVVVCPPFTALDAVREALEGSDVRLGAQNMHWQSQGAFTGEVAAPMLRDLGVSHVVLGHSERRQLFGESDQLVNQKVLAAVAGGLIPIVCVGETLGQREAGQTDEVVATQLKEALTAVGPELVGHFLVAYEPVWAIGTGRTCDALEANRVCALLRDVVAEVAGADAAANVRILYGGSVKPDTIKAQMAQPDIDGALVGGASLDAASFAAIACFDG